MNKKLTIAVVYILLVAVVASGGIWFYQKEQKKIAQLEQELIKEEAGNVAKDFYNAYVIEGYFRGENKIYGDPLYQSLFNKYITEELKTNLEKISDKSPGYNHVLCMQDTPREINVKKVVLNKNNVIVYIKFNKEIADEAKPIVYLKTVDDMLKIYNIECEGIN